MQKNETKVRMKQYVMVGAEHPSKTPSNMQKNFVLKCVLEVRNSFGSHKKATKMRLLLGLCPQCPDLADGAHSSRLPR
jgi:hypothetical protein